MQPLLTFRFNDGTEVRRVGYGSMRLTGQPGNFGPYEAWEDGKNVLRRALELGINLIDTARAYGPGWNERLVAEAAETSLPEHNSARPALNDLLVRIRLNSTKPGTAHNA